MVELLSSTSPTLSVDITPPPPPPQVPTQTTLRPTSPDPSTIGQAVTLSAFAIRLDTNARVPAGLTTVFESSLDQATWTEIARGLTNANGDVTASYVFGTPGLYFVRARLLGDATFGPSTSNVDTQTVQSVAQVPTSLTLTVTPTTVQVNEPVSATGALTRQDTGQGVAGQTIILESSLDQATWTEMARPVTDPAGAYAATLVFTAAGTYFLRARFAGATV